MLATSLRRGGIEVDQYFSQVELLLPFDTDFDDVSQNGFTATVNGNPQIVSPSVAGFGAHAEFDGTGDMLTFANNAAMAIGTGDFTIEAFFTATSLTSPRAIASHGVTVSNGWNFQVGTDGSIRFTYGASNDIDTSSGVVTAGASIYCAFGRESGYFKRIYAVRPVAGSWGADVSWTAASTNSYNFNTTSNLFIGANRNGGALHLGSVDEFRLTVGRWRGDGRPDRQFPPR